METSMINNLESKTGKKLSQWLKIAKKANTEKHKEIIDFLKAEHGLTYGFANLIAHKYRKSDAGSVVHTDDLITAQYEKKKNLRPIYDLLIAKISKFGEGLEISPKRAYVSLRHKKQFALIQPSTKTRVDVGINLKGAAPTERLEASGSFNAMVSHRVRITDIKEVNKELIDWLKTAFKDAG